MVLRESFLKKMIKWLSIGGAIIPFGLIVHTLFVAGILIVIPIISGEVSSLKELGPYLKASEAGWALAPYFLLFFIGIAIFFFFFLPQILALFYFDRFSTKSIRERSIGIFLRFPGIVLIISFFVNFFVFYVMFYVLHIPPPIPFVDILEIIGEWHPILSPIILSLPFLLTSVPNLLFSLILAGLIYAFGYKKVEKDR